MALKIIKLGMDTRDVVARFEQERQALALMEHPNIARVLDAGATPTGRPFFVMELVRGVKITDYCDQAKLPTSERLKLFMEVCSAVQHAHQKGVIHRDLKPSNVLVTLHDGVPVPKVIDFGIAKATQQQRFTDLTIYTQFQQMVGTPLYMAPEQAEMSGLDVDTRSDIYSLGVLLYELLTGRTPFDPKRLMQAGYDEMRRMIREEEPQKPSTLLSTMAADVRTDVARQRHSEEAKLVSSIRGDLDWIVMKALEKDRNRRYETANGLAKDIERHLCSEPVQARPPSANYRFRRFVRRNRMLVGAGAGVAAAILIGSGVSAWQAVRAQRGEARATMEAERANAALADLRSSAPAFAEHARNLAARERYGEALEKLDYAITLRPDVADYRLAKADLLRSQFQFAEAAPVYREALRLAPTARRARANEALCEKLAAEMSAKQQLSRENLLELFATMKAEQRPAAEMLKAGRLLGEENTLLLSFWLERLKELPIPPERPLTERLKVAESGRLELDLSLTSIADLSPLQGMPLERLLLTGCANVKDLTPLQGMPLRHLFVGRSFEARFPGGGKPCSISDLSALHGLPLVSLDLECVQIEDLTPLRGMPLERLNLREAPVRNLSPLQGMPLREIDCTLIPARDFSPLAGAPIEVLSLQSTGVRDLSFLEGMPLKTLLLTGCIEARGYKVLAGIPTLESLMLPAGVTNLPMVELTAIAALRSYPALRGIRIGGSRQDGAVGINVVPNTTQFWEAFDADFRVRQALAKIPVDQGRFLKLKETWEVFLQKLAVSDISPLRGLPISTLVLSETKVTDLTPLHGMQRLRRLVLSGTPVQSLEPLKGLELTELYLDGCPEGLDVAPLSELPTLKALLLPPTPRNSELLRKLPNLKRISFEYDNERQQVAQTA